MDTQQTEHLHVQFVRDDAEPLAWSVSIARASQPPVRGGLRGQGWTMQERLHKLQQRYRQLLHMQRASLGQGVPLPSRDECLLLALGREIACMLPDAVLDELRARLRAALQQQRVLRVTLEFDPSAVELLQVPWELLALPPDETDPIQSEAESFVFLLARVTLVRQITRVGCTAARLRLPLARRAFCASPRQVEPITLRGTLAATDALEPPSARQLDWYSGPNTLGVLRQRLCSGSTQIVHLLCHGEQCKTTRGECQHLMLSDTNGDARPTSAAELVRVLSLAPDLQLVLLQACHAGSTVLLPAGERQRPAVTGIALELLRAGVPAVIAMQGEVSQSAAALFVEGCYDVLAQGGSVERAVAAGRLAMYVDDGVVDWSLPILYQGYR